MTFWRRLFGKQGFEELSQRYASDAAFREQLATNFNSTIKGYRLSAEEKQAVRKYAEGGGDPRIRGHASRVLDGILDKYGHR